MMKFLVKFLFFSTIALLVACLVAPSFIDWNQHKADVMARISPLFARKVDVAGRMSLRILPQPEIMLEDVTIAGAEANSPPALSLKSLEARIRFEPLLEGRIEVESLSLTKPVLNLQVQDDGKTSLSGLMAPSANLGVAVGAVQLNQVSIVDGTLNYSNTLTGVQKTFDSLNLGVKANTLLGPYSIVGDMIYQKSKVGLTIDADLLDKDFSAPVRIAFTPTEGLPQLRLNGSLSLQSGIDLEGEVALSNGRLGSLVNIRSLEAFDFMNDPAEMTGMLVYKAGQFALNDIKAKVGKGALSGKISVQFSQKSPPAVTADLEGSGLVVGAKATDSYMDVPSAYQGSVHVKGKNVVWSGRSLASVDATVSFNDKDWVLKAVQATLPGDGQLKLAGTVTPKSNSASYSNVQITTNDFGKTVEALAPGPEAGIFSLLSGAGPIRKLQFSSSVDVSPGKISLFNIEATAEDKSKISGVVNIDRVGVRPGLAAKLNFADWDSKVFGDAFVQGLMKADADLEITATNFTRDDLKVPSLSLKAKIGTSGIDVSELSASLNEGDSFVFKGHASGLGPVAGLEGSYTLKTSHAADLAKSFGLPPLAAEKADLSGTLKGDAGKYVYTVAGTSDSLLLAGVQIDHPSFQLDAGNPSAVKLALTDGSLWGGKIKADAAFNKAETGDGWSSALKGTLQQVDLKKVLDLFGIRGLTPAGEGSIGFDLASPDNTPGAASGSLDIQAAGVSVENYNPDKLAAQVDKLTELPDNLAGLVNDSFHKNGSTSFKDVHMNLKLNKGVATLGSLDLSAPGQKLSLSGSLDLAAKTYALSGTAKLAKPVDMPPFKLSVTEKAYQVDGGKALEDYVIKNLPPPPAPVVVPPVTPPAPPVAPAVAPQPQQPIGDILKRLNDTEKGEKPATATPPAAATTPAPALDTKKIIEKMQMQELMSPAEGNAPLPLTTP